MFPSLFRRSLPLALALGALSLPFAPAIHAKTGESAEGAPVDVNFFYDTLKEDGSWYNTTDYGDVWQPYIAYKSETWRPYTDGYWSYTDGGWMFVSNEDFGWAVYHYGRWTRLKDIGWAWVPGTDWAPAWVTWRASKPDGNGPPAGPDGAPAPAAPAIDATNVAPADDKNPPPPDRPAPDRAPARDESAGGPPPSDDYIGWAPLPPEPRAYTEVDYTYGPTVDVDFGIDPYDYCFTDVRYFGAPYVAAVIFDPGRSYYYADRSVNITNIYYNHDGPYRGFYAGGPRYERFRGVTQRPIPQYNLRQTSGTAAQAAIRKGTINQINGRNLAVPAPQFARSSVGPDGRVKLTRASALAKAQVNRGAPTAAAAENPAYKQARESFTKQADSYRSQHSGTPGSRAAALTADGLNGMKPETAPKIVTTPRAQQEEREARRAAGEKVPEPESRAEALKDHAPAAPGAEPARPETAAAPATTGGTKRSRREARQAAARQAAEGGAPREAAAPTEAHRTRREARQETQARSPEAAAPRVERHAESGGRTHAASAPRAEPRSAPKAAPAPQPKASGGGGGGEKKDDKKKK